MWHPWFAVDTLETPYVGDFNGDGRTAEAAHCAIRLSLGVGTSEDDVEYATLAFAQAIQESRSSVSFAGCR